MSVPPIKHLDSAFVDLRSPSRRTFNGFMSYRVTRWPILLTFILGIAATVWNVRAQEFLPSPPSDKTLIYILDSQNQLVALPFETGRTPLKITEKAKSSKTSYLEISGERATTM